MAALLTCMLAADGARAAEPTEPERLHAQLVESTETGHKPLASRWQAVIRQRQWTDKSGKYKVYARYVDHDPNLASVTLLVMTKTDDEPSFTEKTIPLAKLGKNEQALVKRISLVRKDVETALGVAAQGDALQGAEGAFDASQAAVDMHEGEVPASYGREAGYGLELAGDPAMAPPVMMAEPWRTDFYTFASNLSAQKDVEGKWTLNWGALQQFQALHETERALAALKKKPLAERPPQAEMFRRGMAYGWAKGGLGEVIWETTLTGPVGAGDKSLKHDLQLPEPFTVSLVAEDLDAKQASRLKEGDHVRLAGRFANLGGSGETPQFVLNVRVLEVTPLSAGAESAGYPSGRPVLRPE